jgi:hypothetical protein
MRQSGAPEQGRLGAKVAPPLPGEALRLLIVELRHAGRPVWRIWSTIAPRIELVAIRDPETGEPVLYRPLAVDQDRRPYFKRRALLWLETREPAALEQLQSHDRNQLRQLDAALMRDLHGRSYDEIANGLRFRGDDCERSARRAVMVGRKLWPRLCAWPWCYWGPDGRPPADWLKLGADATLAAAFETWATGVPVLPAERRAA